MKKNVNKLLISYSGTFPVVGIGASAGGLDAFKKLLNAVPENSGIAYLLVQHLDPHYESMLPDLLQKVTAIPVVEILADVRILPNHVYIIPSNKMLTANEGVLQLVPRPEPDRTQPILLIDHFFNSLAETFHSNVIGVILSGTASDGTRGLKTIKDQGGITIAQDEASAAYKSMPDSAVKAGVVDFVLPPEAIPQKLSEITLTLKSNDNRETSNELEEEELYKQILSLLRIRKGTDFSNYKQTTIRRRILRRMVMNKFEKTADYLIHLQENKSEQDVLYQDLLIPVTCFFRDSKTFEHLCESVFPHLLKNKSRTEPIRIWVAGCSTGEEAYSLAMCFKEYLGDNHEKVQIFATDLSEPAIAKARMGIYSKNEVSDVSPQRLKAFFVKKNDNFQLNKQIRDMCVFAVHNFLKDPPFSKIDFISCRNVLIYMEPYLQKKALTTFHYSLNPKGLLLLGKSETVSSVPALFAPAVKNDKLFNRKDVQSNYLLSGNRINEVNFRLQGIYAKGETKSNDFQKSADDIILSRYTPAGVVVNEALDIVHFRGKTVNYLEQSQGKPTHNLLQLAKPGLAFELRNILHKTKKEKETVVKENIPLQINDTQRLISIEAFPLPDFDEPHFLVLFHDSEELKSQGPLSASLSLQKKEKMKVSRNVKDLRIQQLEQELAQLRDDLRSITEEQEVINEELQRTNEELLSRNEELQSLNEELETGKEELQSSNEELTVVNQEMISLNEQLIEARKYAEAIVSTVREPMLVLDKNLRVKMATTVFYKTFRVSERQTEGKLIYDIGEKQWDIPELHVLFEKILPEKSNYFGFEVSHDFPSIGRRTMLMNAREMTREGGAEKLILLAIEDITESREGAKKIEANEQRFRKLLLQSPFPIAIFKGENMVIDLANDTIKELWDKGHTVEGKSLFETVPELNNQGFPQLLQKVYHTGKPYIGTEVLVKLKRAGVLQDTYFNFVYQPYREADNTITGVACIAQEVTEQVLAKQKLQASETYFRRMTDTVPAIIWITEPDGSCSYLNKHWYNYTGQTEEEALGFGWLNATHPDDSQETERLFRQANADRQPFSALYRLRNKNGEYRWAIDNGRPKFSETGDYEGMIGTVVDVHEEKIAEQRIKESEARYHHLIFSSPSMICILKGEEMVIDIANDAILESWGKGKEIIGKSLISVMPEIVEQGFDQLLHEVYHTGKPYYGYETPVSLDRNGNRELVYYTFIYQPQKNENNEIVGVAILANEVTTEALANRKIRANEENVRRLFQQTPVGIAVYKGENLIIEQVNDIMLQYWGRSHEEAINTPLWEVLPEAKSQGFEAIAAQVFQTGKSYFSPESPVTLMRNGRPETIYAQFAFEPRRDENGTIIGLLGIAFDVTEQVVSRKKVELNEQRYMNLIHSSPVAVYTCDKDGYIQLYNKAAVELWGNSPQIGKDVWSGAWKTFAPDGSPILPDTGPMALTIKTGKPVAEQEIIIERPSGERRYVLAHPQPVFDESGKITGAINTLVDITEIRKSQQILKEKEEQFHQKNLQNEQLRAKELEEKVEKRTLQLSEANQELLLKNEELGKMNKELESFAYISSHDLQEPLRKIQTFSARILKKENQNLSENGKDYFERMQSAAKRMQALIDDLLAYSRTNTTERKFEKTDLNQIVEDVKNELREVIEEKQAIIDTHEMCEVHIIPFQFHQLLHNLFSNALKFSKSGIPPRIFVKSIIATGNELQNTNPALPAGKLLPQERYCHISVADNGIGFEPEFSDKIFEIFQRLHAKEVFPGTGIGLAIVKKIVENHHGYIMATGQVGQGATFDIYLPQL